MDRHTGTAEMQLFSCCNSTGMRVKSQKFRTKRRWEIGALNKHIISLTPSLLGIIFLFYNLRDGVAIFYPDQANSVDDGRLFLAPPEEWNLPKNFNTSKPTLVIQLRGEMGNHLSAIAHGMGIQWYFADHFDLELQPLLRHQVLESDPRQQKGESPIDSPKWEFTARNLQQCFPNLRGNDWEFRRGSQWTEFYQRQQELAEWQAPLIRNKLSLINGRPWLGVRKDRQPVNTRDLSEAKSTVQSLWENNPAEHFARNPQQRKPASPTASISMPFFYSDSLENTFLLDNYVDNIQALFQYDYEACCGKEVPRNDETVLHFRNFQTELKELTSGLEDVTPRQTSNILLNHLKPGESVAITTRFYNQAVIDLERELMQKGLQVRVIHGQSGMEDFCFLLKAKKELVGNFQSTFVFWAAMLGQARTARLYTLDTARLQERTGATNILHSRFLYNFTHPSLRERLKLHLIQEDHSSSQPGK